MLAYTVPLGAVLFLLHGSASVFAQSDQSSSASNSTSGGDVALSSSCQAAAGSLASSDIGTCANAAGLVSLIGGKSGTLEPLTSWISGFCSAQPCSDDALKSASQAVSSGCSADLQNDVPAAMALTSLTSNYNGLRNFLCTQYTSNSTYCLPSIIDNIQTATGKNLSLPQIENAISFGLGALTISNAPAGAFCNDCGGAIQAKTNDPSFKSPHFKHTLDLDGPASIYVKCGAHSFGREPIPSSIRVVGGSGSASSNSSGSSNSTSDQPKSGTPSRYSNLFTAFCGMGFPALVSVFATTGVL